MPFVTYASGFVASFAVKPLAARTSSTTVTLLGTLFAIVFAFWIQFSNDSFGKSWQVYAASGLSGISGSALSISTLSLVSELTFDCPNMAAFVFGVVSFTDQMLNGLIVFGLETLLPDVDVLGSNSFYKVVIVSATLTSSAFLICLSCLEATIKRSGKSTVCSTKL